MKIIFYGAGKCGKDALNIFLAENRTEDELIGFADSIKDGNYCGFPIIPLDKAWDKETAIVITVESPYTVTEIYYSLKRQGFKNIYYFLNRIKHQDTYDDFINKACVNTKNWGECVLPQVEMHILDYCNLNCKGCTHFSPIFEKELPDTMKRINDVKVLKNKFSHILKFYILGGEPFLNPEINLYMNELREILPETDLQIVTNGLLIPSLKLDILDCIRENDVIVSISEYKPTHEVIHKICDRLDEFHINYIIRPYDYKQKFIKPLSLSEHSTYSQKCISNGCINIWDGKISRCPTLMFIDKFNEKFGTNLPNQGIMELNDCPDGLELIRELEKEVPLCKHCIDCEIDWERCGAKPSQEDFAVEN